MGREEDLARLKLIEDEIKRRSRQLPTEEAKPSAASGAFLGTEAESPEPFEPKGESGLSRIAWRTPALVAAYKGGTAGAKAAYNLTSALPTPLPEAAGAVGGITGAALSAVGAQTALEETKRRLGIGNTFGGPESDSFSESFAHGLSAGTDAALAETWGRIAEPIVKGVVIPFAPKYTPEEMATMQDMAGRLKGVYQKVSGRDPAQISWNPFKRMNTPEGDIDATTAAQKLRSAGLDPREARAIVAGNAMTVGEATNNSIYRLFQGFANNASFLRTALDRFKGTRGKMLQMAVNDLGDKFGQVIPLEDLGKTISSAIDGGFRPLQAARRIAINNIELPEGFIFKDLGRGVPALGKGPMSLVAGLGNSPTFNQVQQVREYLGVMAHDINASPDAQKEALAAAQMLDERVSAQMPSKEMAKFYMKWSSVDNEINEKQYNSDFVKGLMNRQGAYTEYANTLLRNRNADNFFQLEKAAGPDVANNVRAALWAKVTKGATSREGELLRPEFMRNQLMEGGPFGRKFLNTVMGPDAIQGYEKLADGMELLNKRMKESFNYTVGLGPLATKVGAGEAVHALMGHTTTAQTATMIAGLLFAPPVVAKIMTNPHAVDLATKLAEGVARGQGPERLTRIASYIGEALGTTPEELIATSGGFGLDKLQAERKELEEGRLPWWKKAAGTASDLMSQDLQSQWYNIIGQKPPPPTSYR